MYASVGNEPADGSANNVYIKELRDMAISSAIRKATTDAIRSSVTTERKWLELGELVKTEYHTAEAFTAIKDEYLDDVVYPAMGDEAVRVMRAEIPRTNSKEFIGASATQQATWVADGKAKVSVRGMGSSYFARVRKYAFPPVKVEEEAEAEGEAEATPEGRTVDATYCMERTTQCIKRLQKSEAPPKHLKRLIELYTEANKLLAEG
jgi:hypothetical protein